MYDRWADVRVSRFGGLLVFVLASLGPRSRQRSFELRGFCFREEWDLRV